MAYAGLMKDEYIVKLIILFVLKNYNKPVTNHLLTQMTLGEVEIDYFLMQKCLFDIMNLEWIRAFKENGDYKYELTEKGREPSGYFEKDIPYIIREKLLFCVKKQQTLELPKSAIESEVVVTEKGEFNVYLKIYEVGDLLFELNINVGSRDLAYKTKEYFLKNAMDIYMNTTKAVMQKI